MTKKEIIKKTEEFAKKKLNGEGSGHDWWHAYRVWQMAKAIGKQEKVDLFIVELAALLHDLADHKVVGDEEQGLEIIKKWLAGLGVSADDIKKVTDVVENISYRKTFGQKVSLSAEAMVVQDADRLEATGAIGIARNFAYGGSKGIEMYNPREKSKKFKNIEQYKKNVSTSINHFYEKNLLLKDLMNTKMAKKIARKRHDFMLRYLDQFYKEWDGKN